MSEFNDLLDLTKKFDRDLLDLRNKFHAICDSIDKSNKECISNLEKQQNNIEHELFNYQCTPCISNDLINYGDKHGI